MNAEIAKQLILDYGWDAEERRRVAVALQWAEEDAECAAAVRDYDQIRASLDHGGDPAATEIPDEPADGWAAFEARLTKTALRRPGRIWQHPLALAAALLLGVLLGWQAVPRSAAPMLSNEAPPTATLAFSPAEIDNRVATFRQVAGVFDDRASWVAIAPGASDLGLAAEPDKAPDNLMLLRLALLRGNAVVSQTDMVIVPGHSAELTLPLDDGENVRYLLATSADDPAHLSIYAEFLGRQDQGEALGAVGSDLCIRPGEVCAAGQVLTRQGEYALAVASARSEGGGRP
ncbi:MAG: hypothetical protein PVJ57_18475 [Phycisphaerae bacterium]|jgi:hypothetical protein